MAWTVERSADADRDLGLILDHLHESALGFGDAPDEAFERAAARVRAIEADLQGLARAPHQGTLRPEVAEGLRFVARGRAVVYFDLDEGAEVVRVLAVFWGGQDHLRRMLLRLLG